MPTLIVKEPKVVIMDMLGTAVKLGFIEKILLPYVKTNVNQYVTEKWNDKKLKKDVEKLRKEAAKDDSTVKIAGANAPAAEQQTSVANYVLSALEMKKETSALQMFRFNMWFDGYKKKKIQTPVYSDVAFQLKKWKDQNIKIFVLSNGWKEANKRFLGTTSHGDLNLMIDGHFDSDEGPLESKDTYTKIAGKVGQPIHSCLFLTKSGKEGLAAQEAGMPIVLVLTHRKNINDLRKEEQNLPRIRTFNELEFGDESQAQASAQAFGSVGQKSTEQITNKYPMQDKKPEPKPGSPKEVMFGEGICRITTSRGIYLTQRAVLMYIYEDPELISSRERNPIEFERRLNELPRETLPNRIVTSKAIYSTQEQFNSGEWERDPELNHMDYDELMARYLSIPVKDGESCVLDNQKALKIIMKRLPKKFVW